MKTFSGFSAFPDYSDRLEACMASIAKNPDKLELHFDIESGYPCVVPKGYKERLSSIWKQTIPQVKSEVPVGKLMIFGTGGNIGNNDFKDLFYGL